MVKTIKARCGRCNHVFEIAIHEGDTDPLDYLLTCSCDKCGAVEPLTFSAPDRIPPRFDHEFERGPYGVCKRCGEEKH